MTSLRSQSQYKRERADGTSISREIQREVKTMILSIILLDSIFLSGLVGVYAGLAVLLLVIPPILLGRKLYVT